MGAAADRDKIPTSGYAVKGFPEDLIKRAFPC
jgi:hypothetical protein